MSVVREPKTCWTVALGLCLVLAVVMTASNALAAGASVRGTVSNASGQAMSSVWVVVEKNGAEQGKSLTGGDGGYYVGNLSNGRYELVVRDGSRELHRRTIQLPQHEKLDIRL